MLAKSILRAIPGAGTLNCFGTDCILFGHKINTGTLNGLSSELPIVRVFEILIERVQLLKPERYFTQRNRIHLQI